MPKNRIILVLGALIAIQPVLGFPRLWESLFQIAAGVFIVVLSIWSSIDKRLTLKAKAQRRQFHRRREDALIANRAVESFIQEEQQQ